MIFLKYLGYSIVVVAIITFIVWTYNGIINRVSDKTAGIIFLCMMYILTTGCVMALIMLVKGVFF